MSMRCPSARLTMARLVLGRRPMPYRVRRVLPERFRVFTEMTLTLNTFFCWEGRRDALLGQSLDMCPFSLQKKHAPDFLSRSSSSCDNRGVVLWEEEGAGVLVVLVVGVAVDWGAFAACKALNRSCLLCTLGHMRQAKTFHPT